MSRMNYIVFNMLFISLFFMYILFIIIQMFLYKFSNKIYIEVVNKETLSEIGVSKYIGLFLNYFNSFMNWLYKIIDTMILLIKNNIFSIFYIIIWLYQMIYYGVCMWLGIFFYYINLFLCLVFGVNIIYALSHLVLGIIGFLLLIFIPLFSSIFFNDYYRHLINIIISVFIAYFVSILIYFNDYYFVIILYVFYQLYVMLFFIFLLFSKGIGMGRGIGRGLGNNNNNNNNTDQNVCNIINFKNFSNFVIRKNYNRNRVFLIGTVKNIIYHDKNYYNITVEIFNYNCEIQFMGFINNLSYVNNININTHFYIINYGLNKGYGINSLNFITSLDTFYNNNNINIVDALVEINVNDINISNNIYKNICYKISSNKANNKDIQIYNSIKSFINPKFSPITLFDNNKNNNNNNNNLFNNISYSYLSFPYYSIYNFYPIILLLILILHYYSMLLLFFIYFL